jgi:hypothetical protein
MSAPNLMTRSSAIRANMPTWNMLSARSSGSRAAGFSSPLFPLFLDGRNWLTISKAILRFRDTGAEERRRATVGAQGVGSPASCEAGRAELRQTAECVVWNGIGAAQFPDANQEEPS